MLVALLPLLLFYALPALVSIALLIWVIRDRVEDKKEEEKDDFSQY